MVREGVITEFVFGLVFMKFLLSLLSALLCLTVDTLNSQCLRVYAYHL